jgi:hypothetical protein
VNFANLPIPADETPETVRAESLRMLGELAQVGMVISRSLQELAALELARGMQAQTAWTAPGAAPARPARSENDIGLSYSRVSRAVRLTLAMRLRLMSPAPEAVCPEPAVQRAPAEAPADAQADEEGRGARRRLWAEVGKGMVRDGVERAIAAEARGERAESLRAELHERLEDPDELAELDRLEFAQIIVRLCKDLGLNPEARVAALRQKAREAAGELGSDPPDTAEQRLGPGSFSPPSRAYGQDDGMGGGRDDLPDAETPVAANDNGKGRPP